MAKQGAKKMKDENKKRLDLLLRIILISNVSIRLRYSLPSLSLLFTQSHGTDPWNLLVPRRSLPSNLLFGQLVRWYCFETWKIWSGWQYFKCRRAHSARYFFCFLEGRKGVTLCLEPNLGCQGAVKGIKLPVGGEILWRLNLILFGSVESLVCALVAFWCWEVNKER
jgi:hypothetical protein